MTIICILENIRNEVMKLEGKIKGKQLREYKFLVI